jgi:hypothetical protein
MDSDGNTLSGDSSAPAAPPSSTPEPSFERSSPASEHHEEPLEQIVDLDRPQYAPNDVRKSLEPEPPADLLRQPEPDALPPIEAPRPWKAEERERFAQLPRETQAYLVEREAERDRGLRQSQNEAARQLQAEREQLLKPEVERLRAEQERARLPLEAAQQLQLQETAAKEFQRRYPELTSGEPEFINQYHAMLHAQDPNRAAQFEADVRELATVAEDTQRITFKAQQEQARQESERRQAISQQMAAWSQQQDAEVAKVIPELGDPERAPELQKRALLYLNERLHMSPQAVARAWNGEPVSLRSWEAQVLLADAAYGRSVREASRNARPVVPPKPQQGGMNSDLNGSADNLAAAADQGNMAAYIAMRAKGRAR